MKWGDGGLDAVGVSACGFCSSEREWACDERQTSGAVEEELIELGGQGSLLSQTELLWEIELPEKTVCMEQCFDCSIEAEVEDEQREEENDDAEERNENPESVEREFERSGVVSEVKEVLENYSRKEELVFEGEAHTPTVVDAISESPMYTYI